MQYRAKTAILTLALIVLSFAAWAAEPFTLVHISDTHINSAGANSANLKAIADEVNAMDPKPAFVVATGDLVEVGLAEEFAVFKPLAERFGMTVYTVPGNHETKWSNWGKLGPKRFLGQDPYYSFDYGGVHFVGLDSTLWLEHYGLIDQSQLAWLKTSRLVTLSGNQIALNPSRSISAAASRSSAAVCASSVKLQAPTLPSAARRASRSSFMPTPNSASISARTLSGHGGGRNPLRGSCRRD